MRIRAVRPAQQPPALSRPCRSPAAWLLVLPLVGCTPSLSELDAKDTEPLAQALTARGTSVGAPAKLSGTCRSGSIEEDRKGMLVLGSPFPSSLVASVIQSPTRSVLLRVSTAYSLYSYNEATADIAADGTISKSWAGEHITASGPVQSVPHALKLTGSLAGGRLKVNLTDEWTWADPPGGTTVRYLYHRSECSFEGPSAITLDPSDTPLGSPTLAFPPASVRYADGRCLSASGANAVLGGCAPANNWQLTKTGHIIQGGQLLGVGTDMIASYPAAKLGSSGDSIGVSLYQIAAHSGASEYCLPSADARQAVSCSSSSSQGLWTLFQDGRLLAWQGGLLGRSTWDQCLRDAGSDSLEITPCSRGASAWDFESGGALRLRGTDRCATVRSDQTLGLVSCVATDRSVWSVRARLTVPSWKPGYSRYLGTPDRTSPRLGWATLALSQVWTLVF